MPTPSLSSPSVPDEAIAEPTADSLIDVVETVISSLATEGTAMVNHTDKGYLWKFKYGTVEVYVQLTGLTDESTFTIWSSVLTLPAKDEPQLMRRLLEMNCSDTLEARFGIVNDSVVVITSRSVADLSPGEISRAATIVATIADENDEPLQQTYGMA